MAELSFTSSHEHRKLQASGNVISGPLTSCPCEGCARKTYSVLSDASEVCAKFVQPVHKTQMKYLAIIG